MSADRLGIKALLLAGGLGTRLRPLTDHWPKCLMPIQRRPLLSYWLAALRAVGIERVLVNRHHHAEQVLAFLSQPSFNQWVESMYEPELLGTAGTVRANAHFFVGQTTLLVHADNWCQANLAQFMAFHQTARHDDCPITMMTFDTLYPQSCGIVELDAEGVVQGFYEKVANPPGHKANGAVYLLEPEVIEFLLHNPEISDFSTQVLPRFVGRIATWHNHRSHVDIGTIAALCQVVSNCQGSGLTAPGLNEVIAESNQWQAAFEQHPIHGWISQACRHNHYKGNVEVG